MMLALLLAAAAAQSPIEKRCGWLDNPTPQNWWLVDRDGEWTLSIQGAAPAPGWDALESTTPPEWVKTNGSYGYGCACASMRVDRKTKDVLEIRTISPRPLKACRNDRRLPRR
jgi:hypothetical protein